MGRDGMMPWHFARVLRALPAAPSSKGEKNREIAPAEPAAARAAPGSAAAAAPPVAARFADDRGEALAKSGESTIVAATAALSVACRNMAVNLAMLMTH